MSTPIRSSRIRILTAPDTLRQIHETARTQFRQTLYPPSLGDGDSSASTAPPVPPSSDHRASESDTAVARGSDEIDRLQHAALVTMRSSGSNEPAEDINATVQHRITRAFVRQHRIQTAIDSLVCSVAEFCHAPSIANGGTWEIRLAIDSDVLPHTSLLLRLVAMQLQLQFECRDAASRQLLREHKKELADRLVAALREPYDIDIQVS